MQKLHKGKRLNLYSLPHIDTDMKNDYVDRTCGSSVENE
jgi:hypothetical protein